ncbi:MAG: PilX N-terminal domain-containing pilus assembly protein [Gammaproteobacteria bacterium]
MNQHRTFAARQRGVALIVALVLLMVLTMVAVISMRTTTLDLRMATNQTMRARVFQVSEAARASIHQVLESHTFNRGWPASIGGSIPASADFTIPDGIEIDADPGLQELYLVNNANHWELSDAAIDMRLREDVDGDGEFISPGDMAADIFVSRVASGAAPGSDTSAARGYEGVGAGSARRLYYRIIARAGGSGGSESVTEANYRYDIR